MRFDTPIKVTEDSGASQSDARRCGTNLVTEWSTLSRTLSTTEVIDCEEVLCKAQAIRQKRKIDQAPEIVTGTMKLQMGAYSLI